MRYHFSVRRFSLLGGALVLSLLTNRVAAVEADRAAVDARLAEATGAALQADVGRAIRILESPDMAGEQPVAELRACMAARLETPGLAKERKAGTETILSHYRRYWSQALRHPAHRGEAAQRLLDDLSASLDVAADWNAIEGEIRRRAGEEGKYVLLGMTGPLRELMVWSRQDTRLETVALPEGAHRTEVHYLDGFSSLGWADWATCGRRGAGGWATSAALFAVVPRYETIEGEEFRVTFLGHETQHFADLGRYPGIPSWRLEYRAKLVELIGADMTLGRLLRKFTEDQSSDPALAHGHANLLVLRDMQRRLETARPASLERIDRARFRAAALELLKEDSATLAAEGQARRVAPASVAN